MDNKPTQEDLRKQIMLDVEQTEKEMAQEEEGAKKEAGKRYCTYEQFEESIKNYDPEKDFRPDLLCGCACPAGSINIIAARPAGGKTSAMINIVRETLTLNANPENEKRKILYVNLEMNYRQILTNLHLSCIYNFAEKEREKLSQLKKTIFAFNHTMKENDWENGKWLVDDDETPHVVDKSLKEAFISNYLKARNLIKKAMEIEDSELKIYDGIGQKMEEVKEEIEKCEDGSLILLDYMQRLPAPDGFHTAQRYLQIQKASAELLKTAIEKQLIVIAGAQLKREDNNKGKETAPSMDSIRESGDIEQDAHNVVILNKDYAEVAKSREGGETAKKMNIKAVKQFVFWETNGKYEEFKKEENNDNRTTQSEKKKSPWDQIKKKSRIKGYIRK